jgi:hypothetical protein
VKAIPFFWTFCMALAALALPAAVFADRPPSWAVGTFRGFNRAYDAEVEITITPRGDVTARTFLPNGKVTTQRGTYDLDQITLDKYSFYISRISNGFRLVQVEDETNTVNYRRSGSSIGTGDPVSWAVGTFSGFNSRYNADVELTITNRGRATARIRFRDGRRDTQTGSVNGSRMQLENTEFNLTRSFNGVRVTQTDDSSNAATYRRTGGGGGGDDFDPDPPTGETPFWAVGRFYGYNSRYGAEIEIDISRNGNARARARFNDGRETTQTGTLRGSRLILDSIGFRVTRTGDGFRAVQDDGTTVDYARSRRPRPPHDPDQTDIPSWVKGSFRGYNSLYDADIDLTITNSGSATANIRFRNGKRETQTGLVRDTVLTLKGFEFTLTRTARGFRAVQRGDSRNTVEYRR